MRGLDCAREDSEDSRAVVERPLLVDCVERLDVEADRDR
jgi:hypothetical protein